MTEEQEQDFKRDTLVTNVMLSVNELSLDCPDPTLQEINAVELAIVKLQKWFDSHKIKMEAA